jgi:proteasome lid subunit RPN8/RPN11
MESPKRQLRERQERANPVVQVHRWQAPPGAAVDLTLLTQLHVYTSMHEHAMASLPNETGGFLLGHVWFDPRKRSWHVEIDEAMPVQPLSQDPAHFTFTWRDVDRVRTHRETAQKALVGWYHTHPDLGIFLSETDLERTHRVLFAEPFQVALVYDPVRHRAGYFFWEGPQIIDASQALWREFELSISPAEPVQPEAPVESPDRPAVAIAADAPTAEVQNRVTE